MISYLKSDVRSIIVMFLFHCCHMECVSDLWTVNNIRTLFSLH